MFWQETGLIFEALWYQSFYKRWSTMGLNKINKIEMSTNEGK